MNGWASFRARLDDVLVIGALVGISALCVAFRYLPMTDLPQHYAMVSILAYHGDPAWGFGDRFRIDLFGSYTSVYLLGGLLARALPLGAVMKLLVALCTVGPAGGLYLLLRAADRPRFWALAAVPFAFGHLWHWGFLNFHLGVGLLFAALALVIAAARGGRREAAWLAAVAVLLLVTHVHTFALFIVTAPLFAWAWRREGAKVREAARAILPLAPAALLAAAFVLTTWKHAEGFGRYRSPDLITRVMNFPHNTLGGLLQPWPFVLVGGLGAIVAAAGAIAAARSALPREAAARRRLIALGAALAAQVVLYFALPLQTATANLVYPRQALLIVLTVPLVLPALAGRARDVMRAAVAVLALVGLLRSAVQIRRFDADARDFAPLVDEVPQNQRIAAMVFVPVSWAVDPVMSPYLHFPVYLQAYHGGDVTFSFASHWNVPVQYRNDYARHPLATGIEWHPNLFSMKDDLPYFDYLVYRTGVPPKLPEGVEVVATSGKWTLVRNPKALPAR